MAFISSKRRGANLGERDFRAEGRFASVEEMSDRLKKLRILKFEDSKAYVANPQMKRLPLIGGRLADRHYPLGQFASVAPFIDVVRPGVVGSIALTAGAGCRPCLIF